LFELDSKKSKWQAVLDRLANQAARNRAAAEALRGQIRTIITAHAGPDRLTAKRVLAQLTCDSPPSIRTIQEHMQTIRAESSASR
jgi:hypothetical protein